MKQEISSRTSSENKVNLLHSTTPSRFRTSSRVKDSPRSEIVNGVGISPGVKAKSRPVPTETNNSQKVRRSLGLNRVKSSEDQKGREVEDVRIVGRSGNRPVIEQFARPRRNVDPGCKKNGDDSDGKLKELQEKLSASENLVKDLQDEVLDLKTQLVKLQSLNEELELQKRQYAEKLSEAKDSASSSRDQEESITEEFQRPNFKDVQKLIANKLEHFQIKKDVVMDMSSIKIPSASLHPFTKVAEMQPKAQANLSPPPPPPPPPLPRLPGKPATTRKAPALVEFYHSLTKREVKKDPVGTGKNSYPVVVNAHSSIVGEIQNRSAHLLAIKMDVETKGDFIKFLIEKVQSAAYRNIDDVLKFVDWLDGELASLADERAVLKHFNWPERKADAMREAAIEYRDLKRLENEVSSYKDDLAMPCETALKKMASLLDKSERSIQRLIKLRNSAMVSYKDCKIPTDWMLDSGMVSKIKQASMKLARMYMKRVSMELESVRSSERESTQEALLLQGVRFAYRAHQFAGGLDSETMCAFEEIRQRVPTHMGGSRELLAGIAS
ncbi:hypothetical protein BVC80_1543g67 [Macleaya cordata]|uniref:Protein CHUP1, chloroplastic n=1 Tax=Macleaya cordata TaxID=56857 RepID=A0A200R1N2_MACCD|nr:hypothetical protein BVC80_1543g67 [Macleaya cordata]